MKRASSPAFIDRVAESQVLDAALQRARDGAAPTLFVGGEAGIGKSRLVAEFTRRAREGGARVLTGGCAPLGGAPLPFGPLVDILRALTDDERTSLPPELGGPAGAWQRLDEFESGQGWVFTLLLGALEELARPLVVVLEDLHWADRSTLDLLALRVQTGRLPGCLIVGTYRSDELEPGHPLRLALAELDRTGRTERVELHRFGRMDLTEQMAGILGSAPEHDVVDDVLGRSDGNPFLAEELLAARESTAGTPTRVRDIVLARVETLSDPTQTLLRVLAASRGPLAHHPLAVVSALPERDLEELLARGARPPRDRARRQRRLCVPARADAGGDLRRAARQRASTPARRARRRARGRRRRERSAAGRSRAPSLQRRRPPAGARGGGARGPRGRRGLRPRRGARPVRARARAVGRRRGGRGRRPRGDPRARRGGRQLPRRSGARGRSRRGGARRAGRGRRAGAGGPAARPARALRLDQRRPGARARGLRAGGADIPARRPRRRARTSSPRSATSSSCRVAIASRPSSPPRASRSPARWVRWSRRERR